MKEPTNREILERILSKLDYAPVAENNTDGIMHSTICIHCNTPSSYILNGNGLCKYHLKEHKIKEAVNILINL